MVTQLMQYGLSQLEAEKFVSLVQLLEIPQEDIDGYDVELDSKDPFSGQLSDSEALIAIKKALEWEELLGTGFGEEDPF